MPYLGSIFITNNIVSAYFIAYTLLFYFWTTLMQSLPWILSSWQNKQHWIMNQSVMLQWRAFFCFLFTKHLIIPFFLYCLTIKCNRRELQDAEECIYQQVNRFQLLKHGICAKSTWEMWQWPFGLFCSIAVFIFGLYKNVDDCIMRSNQQAQHHPSTFSARDQDASHSV